MHISMVQVRMEQALKEKLKRIALAKGLNVTSYIKMTLIEAAEREDAYAMGENGFILKEEKRLLESIRKGEKAYAEDKLEIFDSMESAMASFDE